MNNRDRGLIASAPTFHRRAILAGMTSLSLMPMLRASAATGEARPVLDLGPLEARHGGRIGVCAASARGRVDWRADERFAYCSTFKLFLAACMLERAQKGLERLDRAVPVTAGDMVVHGPITQPAVGSTLTIEQLCKAAVEVSDNPAANILIREMGGLETWQAWYRSIGDQVTRVDRHEIALNTALPGDPRDTTTPEQFAANLDTVMQGTLLSSDKLALLTKWLIETPTGAGRIKAGVPSGYRVGHKTGTGDRNSRNDIGVIWPPSGSPVLIAVFFTGARDASADQMDAIIAEATRRSLRTLGHA